MDLRRIRKEFTSVKSRLDKSRPFARFQPLVFVALAILCLPLSTALLFINYLYILLFGRGRSRKSKATPARTILLSGINTAQGLKLARAFHQNGHKVVGVDYEPMCFPIHVRFSSALTRFYRLRPVPEQRRAPAYIRTLNYIIEQETVDVWIDCTTGVDPTVEGHARTVIEQTTSCRCFALRMDDIAHFASRDSCLAWLRSMDLPVPEIHSIKSRDEVHHVLNKSRGSRRYMLYSPGHGPAGVEVSSMRTLLPRRTLSQTYHALSLVPIQKTSSELWRLEQITEGLPRYSAFAVVVRGRVTAFSASRQRGQAYLEPIDATAAFGHGLLRIVQTFAKHQGDDFTTHIGFDCCVDEQLTDGGIVQKILILGTSVQSLASVLSFQGPFATDSLCRAYLSCLSDDVDDKNTRIETLQNSSTAPGIQAVSAPEVVTPNPSSAPVYCFGQDLLKLGYEPLLSWMSLKSACTFAHVVQSWLSFLKHLVFCQDDIYDIYDPLPFWWSYQVYVPLRLLTATFRGEIERDLCGTRRVCDYVNEGENGLAKEAPTM
ncbi:hypothetical protein PV08_06731 [Exophiala spinifera]|uniref:ATP-grasp domain-containing protein n=1 Tax=Exophiala spinifera TaxID=91928 RepID=A0A0D2B5J0_9EURO|nr:uncharacterized protein PV08_06731 [Exophiala spinifera]KIW13950.1 hypothetical protein PV08_06731 [Exophiala spinifera]